MNNEKIDIVLASSSPRRRELLSEAGVDFRILKQEVDEQLAPELMDEPEKAVKILAERKAKAAVEKLVTPDYRGVLAIIGADTIVVLRGKIFGKPESDEEAYKMLKSLSGCGHDVHTAISLWLISAGEGDDINIAYRTFLDTSYVYFKELSEEQINNYIESGEHSDKAGAYGIQGAAAEFVDHIEGSLDTIIGLPVERLRSEFPELFKN